jgi:hypothetical protein
MRARSAKDTSPLGAVSACWSRALVVGRLILPTRDGIHRQRARLAGRLKPAGPEFTAQTCVDWCAEHGVATDASR